MNQQLKFISRFCSQSPPRAPVTLWLELCKTKVSVPYLINWAELSSLSPADGSSLPINYPVHLFFFFSSSHAKFPAAPLFSPICHFYCSAIRDAELQAFNQPCRALVSLCNLLQPWGRFLQDSGSPPGNLGILDCLFISYSPPQSSLPNKNRSWRQLLKYGDKTNSKVPS